MANPNIGAVMPAPQTTVASTQRVQVPFRRATVERIETLASESLTMTTSEQPIERTIEGSGYVYGIMLNVVGTAATNAATVVFAEDAPWSSLSSIVYRDVNGELVNLSGFNAFISNLVNANYRTRYLDGSGNTNLFLTTAGTVASGGSFAFWLRVPVATNRRDLLGLVGNQDRAQKYSLRTNLAGSGAVYGTAPTNQPTVAINKFYENYSVPLPSAPSGVQQQVFPPGFGTLHYTTATVSESVPAPSTSVNHFLRRIGNTVRWIALVFRAGTGTTPRSTADTNAPTSIRLKVGEDSIINESYNYRRALMWERFGFEFPVGVLVYDAIHDFSSGAGMELGDDYLHTQALVNAQFQISYPSGYTAGGSLTIITDDLIYVRPEIGTLAAG